MAVNYKFPVSTWGPALEVTEADFDILDYPELYVTLDKVRLLEDENYREDIKIRLKINKENRLDEISNDYVKILLSGYKGSGKTVEMRRFHDDLNAPERYFSILIELEKELAIETFEFEDYFILMIYKLAEAIEELDIPKNNLDNLIKELVSETEIEKIATKEAKIANENEVGGGTGFSFFNVFKANFTIKTELAAGTETAKTIREKVKKNPLAIIQKFNNALVSIREDIYNKNKGKDILFIIDGSEKIKTEVYQKLFLEDSFVFRSVNANIISTLPIHVLYNLQHSQELKMYSTYLVPVIKITDESIKELRKIITTRMPEDKFFDKDVLDFFVKKSGGVVREITKIVNTAIVFSHGEKITMNIAAKVVKSLGKEMDEKLTTEQYEFLKEFKDGKFKIRVADKKAGDLIYSLVLLKYNGTIIIHPLLEDFI